MRKILIILFLNLYIGFAYSSNILVYMDNSQTDHLKAYGLAYYALENGSKIKWLLNYRGGSFLLPNEIKYKQKAYVFGVGFQEVDQGYLTKIYAEIESSNMDAVELQKAPKIAVYTPPNKDPWDDAVTLALTYAEIPYETIWDLEVLSGDIFKYDWLHLHHEDFTGQYGKFYAHYKNAKWYREKVKLFESMARNSGHRSVPEFKKSVAKQIKEYVKRGGFLFAMCSATDTIDIALAAEGIDIVPKEIDYSPITANAQQKLDFKKTIAFEKFEILNDPYVYEYSNIDYTRHSVRNVGQRVVRLFEFSAKYDRVHSILTQNHENLIKPFLGQTTDFNKKLIKESVTIMAESDLAAKYIHGTVGKGSFTFLGGHDPEDYAHVVGEAPTNLALHKNSAGYRLILNNILFPSAKKKKQKT